MFGHRVSRNARQTVTAIAVLSVAGLIVTGCASAVSAPAKPTSTDGGGLEKRDSAHLPSDWAKVVSAADKEGEVVLYSTTPQAQNQVLIDAFNAIYPDIKVTVVTDSSASLSARYQNEHNSTGKSPGDVLQSSTFETLIKEHPEWFTDLKKAKDGFLPSLDDMRPGANLGHSVYQAAYTWQILANTSLVSKSDMPKTFKDLADPKWKGKIKLVDPRISSIFVSFYAALFKAYGPGYAKALASNDLSFSSDVGVVAQSVASGSSPIGIPLNGSRTLALEAAHAPIVRIDATPVTVGATTMTVPVDSPHPNAARVFANFLLTAQAQEAQCKITGLGSLNALAKGACSKVVIPKNATFLPLTTTPEQQAAVLQAFGLK